MYASVRSDSCAAPPCRPRHGVSPTPCRMHLPGTHSDLAVGFHIPQPSPRWAAARHSCPVACSVDVMRRVHNRRGPYVAGGQVRGDVLQQQRERKGGGSRDQMHGDGREEQPEAARDQHVEKQHAVLAIPARLQRLLALPEHAWAWAWPYPELRPMIWPWKIDAAQTLLVSTEILKNFRGCKQDPAAARTLGLAFSFSVRRSQATTNAEWHRSVNRLGFSLPLS